MSLHLYSHNPHSNGAKQLAEGLGIKRIKHENSKLKLGNHRVIINWGSSNLPNEMVEKCMVLNHPDVIEKASNKLSFFRAMDGMEVLPKWTDDKAIAIQWSREGEVVVCRTILTGHSGAGIVIANTEEQLVDAPLYVKYIKKQEEYRIHLMQGLPDIVFDVQRKARRLEVDDPNWQVRNHQNGFIYQRNDIKLPKSVLPAAIEVFEKSELDFGGVDVIFNQANKRSYVLEINTAPGLTGTTLVNYVTAFSTVHGER